MPSILKKLWPLLAAIALFVYLTGGLITNSVRRNGGRFVYALDDPYIHMAIAKNFALHGVWSVTAEGFSSSTSAPLWTLILAIAYRLFGVNDLTPLILNILAALALLTLAHFILARFHPALLADLLASGGRALCHPTARSNPGWHGTPPPCRGFYRVQFCSRPGHSPPTTIDFQALAPAVDPGAGSFRHAL